MGAKRSPAAIGVPEKAYQLRHPSAGVIWERAVEVFGNEDLARRWTRTPLSILDQRTPEQYSLSEDKGKRTEVLVILGRIDYGMFS